MNKCENKFSHFRFTPHLQENHTSEIVPFNTAETPRYHAPAFQYCTV